MPGKVLIAEEQAECCQLFKMFLQRCGYEVTTVHEGMSCVEALQDGAADRSPQTYLFPRLRTFTDANLRKQMTRLIRLSGSPVWPKLFQNIRSTRQTELEERFPRKTVCEWTRCASAPSSGEAGSSGWGREAR